VPETIIPDWLGPAFNNRDTFLRTLESTARGLEGLDPVTGAFLVSETRDVHQLAGWLLDLLKCGSPIEQLLLAHLMVGREWLGKRRGYFYDFGRCPGIVFAPQYEVESDGRKHRVDIYVGAYGPTGTGAEVGIECDGHDFHERTKEQAAADKQRERRLVRAGLTIIRFSGSEIFQQPEHCAREVFYTLERMVADLA